MPSASTITRPAVAALVLLAAVALTGLVLFWWWPGGVALGLALGAGSVLAVGASMQASNARVPSDEALQQRLGVRAAAPAQVAPVAVAAAPRPRITVPEVAPLHAQQDDLFFSTGSAADAPAPEAAPAVQETAPAPDVHEAAPAVAVAPAAARPAAADRDAEDDAQPDTIPATDFVLTDRDDSTVRADLERLKDQLGDDYSDFARAVRIVVATQYASAARLQRELDVPYSRARRLLTDLEQQHFVGPATGSLPRVVLMPKDALPDLERLLEEV